MRVTNVTTVFQPYFGPIHHISSLSQEWRSTYRCWRPRERPSPGAPPAPRYPVAVLFFIILNILCLIMVCTLLRIIFLLLIFLLLDAFDVFHVQMTQTVQL